MKNSATKQKIVDVATRIFAENGYDETKIDTIVREAGISKPTFYSYFKSKKELRVQLVQICEDVFVDELTPFLPLDLKTDNLADFYRIRFGQLFQCMAEHRDLMIISLQMNPDVDILMSHISAVVQRNIRNETGKKLILSRYRDELFADILINNSVMLATKYIFSGKETVESAARLMTSLLLERVIEPSQS